MNNLLNENFDPEWQQIILLILNNNLGAGYEAEHQSQIAGQAWSEVNTLIEQLVSLNPDKAFEFGLTLANLNRNEEPSKEWKYLYLRGTGLTILAQPQVVSKLSEALKSPYLRGSMSKLLTRMVMAMELPSIPQLTREQAFSTPEFYNWVISLFIAINLDPEMRLSVTEKAKAQLADPRVREQIAWYLDLEDTRELAERLLSSEA